MQTVDTDLSEEEQRVLVEAFTEVVRELRRTMPVPRGAPYYGLDIGIGDLSALDDLCREGVFRKYQRAAVLECGLAGAARWWSIRFGCRVSGFDDRRRILRAARALHLRADSAARVEVAAMSGGSLPTRRAAFTHVWCVDPSGEATKSLRESLATLRPSGFFGLHGSESWPGEIEEWEEAARAAGFATVERRRVPLIEPPSYLGAARQLLKQRLEREAAWSGRFDPWAELPALRRTAVQLIAQKAS